MQKIKVKTQKNLDLQKLVEDLKNQVKVKKDFVIPSAFLSMKRSELQVIDPDGEYQELRKLLIDTGISVPNDLKEKGRRITLTPLDVCHVQIADKLGIPKRYYDKMMNNGNDGLLDTNVSHWFKKGGEVNYLLRTFIDPTKGEGVARALLSDRFFALDNFDVLMACLEAIQTSEIPPDFFKIHGEITEKNFYVRFSAPSIELNAPNLLKKYRVPDADKDNGSTGVIAGFVIANSEVGLGQFTISPRALILRCENGMTFADDSFSKRHLGEQMSEFSEIKWSEDTRRKNYELIISQVKDCVKLYLSKDYLGSKISKLERLASNDLKNPLDAVKNVCTELGMGEEKQKSILDYFIKGADTSPFGVAQALTYYAHKNADADERYELEVASVKIMEKANDYDKPFIRDKKTNQIEIPVIASGAN